MPTKRGYVEQAMTGALVLAAIAVATSVVKTAFFTPIASEHRPPAFIDGWEEASDIGHTVTGTDSAPITIVALVDLQCPACAAFHAVVEDLLEENGELIRLVYVHYPLDYHELAMPAARAAECAVDFDAFAGWVQAIYERQDSLGKRGWGAYARDAGIADTAAIAQCATSGDAVPSIAAGIAYGRRVGVDAVPTVILNGWRFGEPPGPGELQQAIDVLLDEQGLAGWTPS